MSLVFDLADRVLCLHRPGRGGHARGDPGDERVQAVYLGRRSVLEVRGLVAGYATAPVLRGHRPRRRAARCALLGRNGMGKTTLLRAICGLRPPAVGAARSARGTYLQRLRPDQVARRGVALVPQGRRVFASLCVRENLRIAGRRRGRNGWDLARVFELFPRLAERARQLAGTLSGGEQQMLAIGRALMMNPRLLVMDEPSEGLAPAILEQLVEHMASIRASGQALLIAEQNVDLALAVADGSVLGDGGTWRGPAPEALRCQPQVRSWSGWEHIAEVPGHRNAATGVFRGGTVLTWSRATGVLSGTDVLLRDGRIEVGWAATCRRWCRGHRRPRMAVMPGLVETHFHMWSTLGRNFISEGFEYFPAKLATSAHYEPIDFYRSDRWGSSSALSAGITTVHDWSHNTRTPEHADAELRAHRDSGIRARYAYGHRDGLPADEPLDFADIDRVARSGSRRTGAVREGVVHLGVNLRGPAWAAWPLRRGDGRGPAARPAGGHPHVPGPRPPVDATVLEQQGYLGPDFLIAHFIAATQADREAMARTGHAAVLRGPLRAAARRCRRSARGAPAVPRCRRSGVLLHRCLVARTRRPVPGHGCRLEHGHPVGGTATASLRR